MHGIALMASALIGTGPQITERLPVAPAAFSVLWIQCNGILSNYSIDDRYSELRDFILARGAQLDSFDAGDVDAGVLAGYRVVIVSLAANWDETFTAAEAAAFESYVSGGGGLYLWGDNPNTPNENIQPIGDHFGLTFGSVFVQDDCFTTVPWVVPPRDAKLLLGGSVFGGEGWLKDVFHNYSGRYVEHVGGRVAGLGDVSAYSNDRWGQADNTALLMGVGRWLAN
ncbi:MAG: hypothetical protein CME06_01265 [Gemmatimonadetes bacterium]|nr:hypothetical protein [Gemmatimonadota bacterium]